MPHTVSYPTRLLLRAAFTAALLGAVVVLGQLPFGSAGGDAVLRVALRTVQAKVEVCRDLSAEELAALPAHMRRPRDCRELAPDYQLSVRVGDRPLLDERVRPGGLRGDRPLIVDRQLAVAPGRSRLEVRLTPAVDERLRGELDAAAERLPSYTLDRQAEFTADRVTLVVLDDANGRLKVFGE